LYFSIGAATTATFGDIAPNHWFVRLCVCLQVLLSVILMGLLVSELAEMLARAQPPTDATPRSPTS
jgi:hypothetical protein